MPGVVVHATAYRPHFSYARYGAWRCARSDETGAWFIAGLAAPFAIVVAHGGGHASADLPLGALHGVDPLVVPLRPDGPTEATVRVMPWARITGTVASACGRPLADHPVYASPTSTSFHPNRVADALPFFDRPRRSRTNALGAFTIEGLVGGWAYDAYPGVHFKRRVHVMCSASGCRPVRLVFDESEDGPAEDVAESGSFNTCEPGRSPPPDEDMMPYALNVPASSIVGTVVHADGSPAVGARVIATPSDRPRTTRFDDEEARHAVTWTDGRGAFRLARLTGARYRVTAKARGSGVHTVHDGVDATETALTLCLPPLIDVQIEIVDEAGRPLRGAIVSAVFPTPGCTCIYAWDRAAQGVSDANGRATLRGLPEAGPLRLYVQPPDGWIMRGHVGYRSHADPSWSPAGGRIVLRTVHAVLGVVVDSAGDIVEGAEVVARPLDVDDRSAFGATWDAGRFHVSDFLPGRVEVTVTLGDRNVQRIVTVPLAEALVLRLE